MSWCYGFHPQPPHAADVAVETSQGQMFCPNCFRRWQAEDFGKRGPE